MMAKLFLHFAICVLDEIDIPNEGPAKCPV